MMRQTPQKLVATWRELTRRGLLACHGPLRWLLIHTRRISRPDLVMLVMDRHPKPDDLIPGRLVVVQDGPVQKWACFRCPCGCGARMQLSLNPTRRPRWSVSADWLRRPTVAPSVHQRDGCRAHFWIRKGRVEWCGDSGR